MPITVSVIENKEFKTKMRGYDPEEVDIFLDEICDEMVAMQEEILSLQSRLSRQSTPAPAPVPAPVSFAPKQEEKNTASFEAAQKLMESAQKVYDSMVTSAQKEADEILKNAKAAANPEIDNLEQKKAALEEEIDMLKAAAKDYRSRFTRLVEDQQHILNAENTIFED